MWVRAAGALLALVAAVGASTACGVQGPLFRQYEYEEEMYLSLDGSAQIYVNSSVAALDALRGATLNPSPNVPVDRTAARAFFTSPVTRVTRVSTSRRSNRRFVHVRIDVDDVRRLGGAAPFAWSSYRFGQEGDLFVYRQSVGSPSGAVPGDVHWTGGELVAFRLHLPSKIVYHNAGPNNLKRGNILVWEQALSSRLHGDPLAIEARMESQSILYRTLYLFGGTFVVVVLLFVVVIWRILRLGAAREKRVAGGQAPPV